jgi:hypothetical protein
VKKNLLLFLLFIILAAVAWFIYNRNTHSSIADQPLTEFAIADTAAIDKLFIAEPNGTTALLEKIPGTNNWMVNKKYPARKDGIDLLMKTFARMRVRGNVAANAQENMLKVLATGGKKVEVYMGGTKPVKIYYVGPATPDHMGTIMLLEIPGIGRSQEPYITHMEGFTGFLTTRFFADENDWRYTGVFEYPALDFKQVTMMDRVQPANSFRLTYLGGNKIALYQLLPDGSTIPIGDVDSSAVKDYLLLFKKVHFESYRTQLRPEAADSIGKLIPAYSVELVDNRDEVHRVDLIWKRSTKTFTGPDGLPFPWDLEYFWGKTEAGELAMAQTYVFNPLITPLSALRSRGTSAR